MQKEFKDKIIEILNFFNLNESNLIFISEFNIYLISLKKDKYFDVEFCTALEAILHQILPGDIFLKVDLNNNFSNLLNNIKDEVNVVVNQVKYYNQPIGLKSKNAFERRLKHLYIENVYTGIRHESIGDGVDRQIIIYPQLD